MSRRTKLTPDLIARIADTISAGNFRYVAAASVGVSRASFCEWMREGRQQAFGLNRQLLDAVEAAELAAEAKLVATVQLAAKDDACHARWWLERKFPERWGRKDRYTVKKVVTFERGDTINKKRRILSRFGIE